MCARPRVGYWPSRARTIFARHRLALWQAASPSPSVYDAPPITSDSTGIALGLIRFFFYLVRPLGSCAPSAGSASSGGSMLGRDGVVLGRDGEGRYWRQLPGFHARQGNIAGSRALLATVAAPTFPVYAVADRELVL